MTAPDEMSPERFFEIMEELHSSEFLKRLGAYHALWSAFDITIDVLLTDLLSISATNANILLAGMEYGRKIQLALNLLVHSDRDNAAAIRKALQSIRAMKRDALTHGWIATEKGKVTFHYRKRGGDYGVETTTFTDAEFLEHVTKFARAGLALDNAMGDFDSRILVDALEPKRAKT